MKAKNLNGGICSGRGNIFCTRFVSQLSKLSYECTKVNYRGNKHTWLRVQYGVCHFFGGYSIYVPFAFRFGVSLLCSVFPFFFFIRYTVGYTRKNKTRLK